MKNLITILLVCISTLSYSQVDLVRLSDMEILDTKSNISLQYVNDYTIAMVEDSIITIIYTIIGINQGDLICRSSYTEEEYRVGLYLPGYVTLYLNEEYAEDVTNVLVFYNEGVYENIKSLINLRQ